MSRTLRVFGAAVVAVVCTVVCATAGAAAPAGILAPAEVAAAAAGVATPDGSTSLALAEARDLGWSAAEAPARFAAQLAAGRTGDALRQKLGAAFGGAWWGAGGLHVAVTTPAAAEAVRAAGATPTLVTHSVSDLAALRSGIDRLAAAGHPPTAVTSWYVDVPSNAVVVMVDDAVGGDPAAVARFLAGARRFGDAVRVVHTTRTLTVRADLVGGDAIFVGNARCSLGFSARTGGGEARGLTAGHCTKLASTVEGADGTTIGDVTNTTFGNAGDFGAFAAGSGWTPTSSVAGQAGNTVTVTGSQEAPVGAAVCRSGSTSGYHCGKITATDVTANYEQGVVEGLTQTTVCSEDGDSGGPFVAGSQAQGVLSGGSGDCLFGGETLFQPVNEILSTYHLTLVTG